MLPARHRLADVVQDGAEAKRRAATEIVGERLVEQHAHLSGSLAGVAVEVALDREQLLEHLDRVIVDVEVVVRVLDHASQRGELRQHGGRRPELVEQPQAGDRIRPGDQQPQLGELALPGRLAGASRRLERQLAGPGRRLEAELGAEPGRAQDPQRVLGEAARRDRPQHARLEVGGATGGINRARGRVAQRNGDRVGGEVALTEIRLDRRAAQTGDVGMPAAVGGERSPGAELGRELEGDTSGALGDASCEAPLVAVDGEVEVDHRAAADRVTNRATDDPRILALGEGAARHTCRRRRAQSIGEAHERVNSRGTRGAIAVVTS